MGWLEFKDSETMLRDLRSYIKIIPSEGIEDTGIRDITECSVDISRLMEYLNANKELIGKIYYFCDEALILSCNNKDVLLEEALNEFNLIKVQ